MYRITVVDSSNYDLRHYSSMPVFAECGFEIVSHTTDPEKALAAASAHTRGDKRSYRGDKPR